jgi:hypothetical protein
MRPWFGWGNALYPEKLPFKLMTPGFGEYPLALTAACRKAEVARPSPEGSRFHRAVQNIGAIQRPCGCFGRAGVCGSPGFHVPATVPFQEWPANDSKVKWRKNSETAIRTLRK